MNPGLAVRLRPAGPWRSGPDSGARNRVDPIYHSDSLYAAVTSALALLGVREEWLEATARSLQAPAVRFSSCFPFLGELAFITPPRSLWPPMAGAPASTAKVRWKSARFIPLPAVQALLAGQPLNEDEWIVDGASECLLPLDRPGPFRAGLRWSAAVDRLTGAAERHATACIEYHRDAGLWALIAFADEEARSRWSAPLRGALRLLADSGFGGERSRGWGRAAEPEFVEGTLPEMILPPSPPPDEGPAAESGVTSHWLLALFTPGPQDAVDWKRGNYSVVTRGGRIESPAGFGQLKKQLQMVAEGSVLVAGDTLQGMAPDVAPDNFPHPVLRAGFALSIPLPAQVTA
jgi:CRISPR type III-A-associated RAMP protein Csm4